MALLCVRILLWQPVFRLSRDKHEPFEALVRRHPSHRRVRWDPDGRRGLPEGEDVVPLLCAILCNDVQMVRTLLECGADPVRCGTSLHCQAVHLTCCLNSGTTALDCRFRASKKPLNGLGVG